jgi:hypothetical protein
MQFGKFFEDRDRRTPGSVEINGGIADTHIIANPFVPRCSIRRSSQSGVPPTGAIFSKSKTVSPRSSFLTYFERITGKVVSDMISVFMQ